MVAFVACFWSAEKNAVSELLLDGDVDWLEEVPDLPSLISSSTTKEAGTPGQSGGFAWHEILKQSLFNTLFVITDQKDSK